MKYAKKKKVYLTFFKLSPKMIPKYAEESIGNELGA